MKISEAQIIAIDFETTGLTKDDIIIEWGISTAESARSEVFNPQRDIEPVVSAVHGYTKKNLAKYPVATKQLIQPLVDMLDGKVVLIHNADFDWRFLLRECERLWIEQKPNPLVVLDTMQFAQRLYPTMKSHSLGALYYATGLDEKLGENNTTWHSGQWDARITLQLYQHMIQEWFVKGGADDLQLLLDRVYAARKIEVMPFGKHKGTGIVALPENYMWWWLCKREMPKIEELDADLEESIARAAMDPTMFSPGDAVVRAANNILKMCAEKRANRCYPTKIRS